MMRMGSHWEPWLILFRGVSRSVGCVSAECWPNVTPNPLQIRYCVKRLGYVSGSPIRDLRRDLPKADVRKPRVMAGGLEKSSIDISSLIRHPCGTAHPPAGLLV